MGSTFRYSGDELYHYGRSVKDGAPGVGTGNWRREPSHLRDALEKNAAKYRKSVDDRIAEYAGMTKKKLKAQVANTKNRIGFSNKPRVAIRVSKAYAKAAKAYANAKENFHKNKMEDIQRKTEEQEAKNKLLTQQLEAEKMENQADRDAAKYQREDDRNKAKDLEEAKKKQTEQEAKENASVNGAKVWRSWSNEELEAYVKRQNLEKQADEVRMNQLDRPRQYAYEAMGYAKMGIDVLNTFSEFSKAYNNYLHPDKKEKPYSQTQAEQLLDFMQKVPKEELFNTDFVKELKQDLEVTNGYLEVIKKIEQKANPNQQNQNDNNNQNQNGGKKKNK